MTDKKELASVGLKAGTWKDPLFIICCYGYFVNGMAVLVIGSILPALIAEAGITFAAAGGLLSFMAIGNFSASFIFPVLVSWVGKRISITITTILVPVSFLFLTSLPPIFVMYLLMFLCGISRGSITIINNGTVNELCEDPIKLLNYLHCSFAVGAFLAPFATAVLFGLGFGWRTIIYILAAFCATSCITYAIADYKKIPKKESSANLISEKEDRSFLKNMNFYCVCFLLFFYVGFENCVNGWFVTYLQSTGIVSETFSSALVSITWIVIMVGRLICAALSEKISKTVMVCINCVGSAVCFLILIFAGNISLITFSLIGMGLFMAGIYPNSVAGIGSYIKGSTLGMSILTAISSLGGILAPQLVGSIAQHIGMVPAIGILSVNALLMVLLAFTNFFRSPAKKSTKLV